MDYIKMASKELSNDIQDYGNESNLRRKFAAIKNQALVDLLEEMLQLNPAFRPSAAEML